MVGYPHQLNSKADYLYVREHFPRERWLPDFQALLDNRQDWFFEKHLVSKDAGVTDDTHKIVETTSEDEGEPTYDQYELRDNPTAAIHRLGFTVEEVRALMEE